MSEWARGGLAPGVEFCPRGERAREEGNVRQGPAATWTRARARGVGRGRAPGRSCELPWARCPEGRRHEAERALGALGPKGEGVLHGPGIEPGPPAWQARILPLNHPCAGGGDPQRPSPAAVGAGRRPPPDAGPASRQWRASAASGREEPGGAGPGGRAAGLAPGTWRASSRARDTGPHGGGLGSFCALSLFQGRRHSPSREDLRKRGAGPSLACARIPREPEPSVCVAGAARRGPSPRLAPPSPGPQSLWRWSSGPGSACPGGRVGMTCAVRGRGLGRAACPRAGE